MQFYLLEQKHLQTAQVNYAVIRCCVGGPVRLVPAKHYLQG